MAASFRYYPTGVRPTVFAFLALILVTLTAAGCQRADAEGDNAYHQGIAAYNNHDDAEAARLFSLAAERGNTKANTLLGIMYLAGEGVSQDRATGVQRLKLSAVRGDADGQFWYAMATIVHDDYNDVEFEHLLIDALPYLKMAADQGHAQARVMLGEMYFSMCQPPSLQSELDKETLAQLIDAGLPKNDADAITLFTLAAEQGEASGLLSLGSKYRYGNCLPKDAAEAVRWYRLAADQGDAAGQESLGQMYYFGEGVPENDAEAARWYKLAADQGNPKGQFALARRYRFGEGVPKNGAEAVRWYTRAADQAHIGAQTDLAYMYRYGWGVPQNFVEAYKWYNILGANSYGDLARRDREELGRNMTHDQIAEAQRLSSEWKPTPEKRALLPYLH